MNRLGPLQTVAVAGVVAGWTLLAVLFLRSRARRKGRRARRDPVSVLGLALQGLGFALVFDVDPPRAADLRFGVSAAFGLALFLPSLWLLRRARRHLGKQWSLAARVLEDHRLVTDGPYRYVRHPIYTGMLGMLLATALALGAWRGILPAVAAYLVGTAIRIRSEEALLRRSFGDEFEAYARRVPALFPRLRSGAGDS